MPSAEKYLHLSPDELGVRSLVADLRVDTDLRLSIHGPRKVLLRRRTDIDGLCGQF